MNCPGSMLVFKNGLHSYKDMPMRIGELGQVHRHEAMWCFEWFVPCSYIYTG